MNDPQSTNAQLTSRAALYLRAERALRSFFSAHFDELCSACGRAASRGQKHLCCCLGVDCLRHIAQRPVLLSIVNDDPALARIIADHVTANSTSLLGATGCELAWGRPPACNTCVCSQQWAILKAVLAPGQTARVVRALRVCHDLTEPVNATPLAELETQIDLLEEALRDAAEWIGARRVSFDTLVEERIAALEREDAEPDAPASR